MRQLRDDTHLILDGEVRVYQRERSKRWQASFNIDGHTIRISTGKRDLAEAKFTSFISRGFSATMGLAMSPVTWLNG